MRTPVDERLRSEARRFALRFSCADCVHRDAADACSLGFPVEEHARPDLERPELVFCKAFELA